ncbi:MAG: hypothetical protein ACN4IE_08905, partial [Ilumatobacter sp.]
MKHRERRTRGVWLKSASALVALGLVAAACGGDDDDSSEPAEETASESTAEETATEETGGEEAATGDRSITVALVGNDNIEKMAELAPDNFTAETGISVEFTVLDEQTLREVTTRDVGAGG